MKNILLWIGTAVVLLLPNPLLDPDFGWHLRTGQEIITRHEIPRVDWYSHTVPSYSWVDHEWLQAVVVASLYRWLGMTGVRVWYMFLGFVLIAVVLRLLQQRGLDITKHSAQVAVVTSFIFVALSLFRPQIVTAIGFCTVLFLLQSLRSANS